jgi:catechol 2,3-dioxygenase-like lactoylglutathione lyase family enzyme
MIRIDHLDHLVLTVADLEKTVQFYTSILGMTLEEFGERRERKALRFGSQKINLHLRGKEFEPKAKTPLPGSADLCFIAQTSIEEVQSTLKEKGIPIEEGPVKRTGATGPLLSIYLRDPDGNLLELSNYF